MPIFDMKCSRCREEENDVFLHNYKDLHKCRKCNGIMIRLFSNSICVQTFPKDGLFLEHVCPEGKRFYNKKEILKYEKKHAMDIECVH